MAARIVPIGTAERAAPEESHRDVASSLPAAAVAVEQLASGISYAAVPSTSSSSSCAPAPETGTKRTSTETVSRIAAVVPVGEQEPRRPVEQRTETTAAPAPAANGDGPTGGALTTTTTVRNGSVTSWTRTLSVVGQAKTFYKKLSAKDPPTSENGVTKRPRRPERRKLVYEFSIMTGYVKLSTKRTRDLSQAFSMVRISRNLMLLSAISLVLLISMLFLWREGKGDIVCFFPSCFPFPSHLRSSSSHSVTRRASVPYCNMSDCHYSGDACAPFSSLNVVSTLRAANVLYCPMILQVALMLWREKRRALAIRMWILVGIITLLPPFLTILFLRNIFIGIGISLSIAVFHTWFNWGMKGVKKLLPFLLHGIIFNSWQFALFQCIDPMLTAMGIINRRALILKCVVTPIMVQIMDATMRHPLARMEDATAKYSDDVLYYLGIFQRIHLATFRMLPLFLIEDGDYYGVLGTLFVNVIFDMVSRIHGWRVLWYMSRGEPVPPLDRVTKVMNEAKPVGK